MGKLLAKIEKRGLVARHPNPADRRASLVELTNKGRELVDEFFPRQLELEAKILQSFDEAWRENFIASLDELSRRIAEIRTSANPVQLSRASTSGPSDQHLGAGHNVGFAPGKLVSSHLHKPFFFVEADCASIGGEHF